MRATRPVVTVSHDYEEAGKSDIMQQVMMSPEDRQNAAKTLRDRYYGTDAPDVRDARS